MQRSVNWFHSNRMHLGLYYILLPFLLYSATAILVTWPLATQLSTHVAGPAYADSLEFLRLGWWGKYALQNGLNPFYQSLLGYPEGFFSATQWAQPLVYWPISLLSFVVNPAAAFNLWLLLTVILNGLTAYWLCRYILSQNSVPSVIAALVGGLIFMIFPTAQGHIFAGHINVLSNYAFPIVLLCLLRILEGKGEWRTALVGALAMLILALSNYVFLSYLILPTFLFVGAYFLLFRRKSLTLSVLRNLGILCGVSVVLTLPFYIPLALEITDANRPMYLQQGGWIEFSTDPLAFVSLSPISWTAPIASEFSYRVLVPTMVEGSAYLGVAAVTLAIIAIVNRRKEASMWLVVALGCMLFSLGPILKWNGDPIIYKLGDQVHSNIVLPYALFQSLPVINVSRTPARFNLFTGLALGMLAASGLCYLLDKIYRREFQILLASLITALVVAEYQVSFPFHTSPVPIADYFYILAQRSDSKFSVLEVPFSNKDVQTQALLEQTVHHKPLIAGYVSRATPVDPARLTFLSSVVYGMAYTPTLDSLPTDVVRGILREHGVGVVVYHWITVNNRDQVFRWAQKHFGKPVHNDQWMSIFEVPEPQQSVDTTAITFSEQGWWISQNLRWMTDDNASIIVYSPVEQNRRFNLTLSPLLQSRHLQIVLNGEMIHARQVDSTPLDFWLHLTPGTHMLRFVQPEGCTPVPIQPACLLQSSWDETTCKLQESDKGLCVSIALNTVEVQQAEPEFKLVSIPLRSAEATLYLTASYVPDTVNLGQSFRVQTTWQVDGKLAGDYHYFVHVLDQSGQLVAQYDGIPGENTFPTAKWQASQQWMESMPLTLPSDLSMGHYSVYTGWYSYPDLKRLSVESDMPHASDGLVYLGDIEAK